MLTPETEKRLHELVTVFLEENTKINLSALRTEETCWVGNVLDSLAFLELLPKLLSRSPVASRDVPPSPLASPDVPPSPALPPMGEGSNDEEKVIVHKDALSKKLVWNAREMRKSPTKAEEILWDQLRFDQLGVRFRRQHPVRGKILDFYCHDARLGIELDGEVHDQKEQKESDKEKEFVLKELHGIRIVRFRNDEVLAHLEKVLESIRKELSKSPPPPSGEGLGVGASPGEGLGVGENLGKRLDAGIRIIDIGTGGGFPLLPLAITLPEIKLTGVDATQKKIDAVSRIIESLKLSNVSLVSGRSEELGHDPNLREQFDIVLSRAVADTSVLLEYCSPFTKPGGFVVLWKSTKMDQELQDSLLARAELSCHLVMQHVYELPEGFGERQLLVFEKGGILPAKYPRPVGIPSKKPLQ